MEKTTLEVGDKIRIKNAFCDYVVEIERVTKTQAMTENGRFRRTLWMGEPVELPKQKWRTADYTHIKQ